MSPRKIRKSRTKPGELPQVLRKPDGRLYCNFKGKRHYLHHPLGSPELDAERLKIVTEYAANSRISPGRREPVTVAILVSRFLDWAEGYYVKNGRSTGSYERFCIAVRPLFQLYEATPVTEFRPLCLKAVRQVMLDSGRLCRGTINQRIGFIKQIFEWGVAEELVPETVAGALKYVTPLEAGKTTAVDYDDVLSVDFETVKKTLPHCPHPIIADMIQVQLYGGMRPQDICNMRLCDIDRSKDVWEYAPWEHKTEHKVKRRGNKEEQKLLRWLGPTPQEILEPYLTAKASTPEAFLFSPADAVKLLTLEKRMGRKSKVQPSQQDRSKQEPKRKPGSKYKTGSYRTAIWRACDKAGIPRWSPNQLRHTWATYVKKEFGPEAARIILGHKSVDTTMIYLDKEHELAREVARKIG